VDVAKKIAGRFGIAVGLYVLLVAGQNLWLPWFGWFLARHDDSPDKADLVIVSTGSYERFDRAVEMVLNGRAERLLILGDRRIETHIPGKSPPDLAADEAAERGVAASRLTVEHSTSTLADANIARRVMTSAGFKSAILVSDFYNMRRAALVFDHVFRDTESRLYYQPVDFWVTQFHPDLWWRYPAEFEYVLKEWMKLPLDFYRTRFLAN
jgi:uncharacterized SAM-binding protein YcdF (DUF218 family)